MKIEIKVPLIPYMSVSAYRPPFVDGEPENGRPLLAVMLHTPNTSCPMLVLYLRRIVWMPFPDGMISALEDSVWCHRQVQSRVNRDGV